VQERDCGKKETGKRGKKLKGEKNRLDKGLGIDPPDFSKGGM